MKLKIEGPKIEDVIEDSFLEGILEKVALFSEGLV
jgi:hypothetical protein